MATKTQLAVRRAMLGASPGARRSTPNRLSDSAPVSRNLGARSVTTPEPYGFTGTRRHGNKASMTKAQRDSTGRFSDWNRSPYVPKGGWR